MDNTVIMQLVNARFKKYLAFPPQEDEFPLIINPSYSADYYISNNGNDSNNGNSPETAWKTLAKAMGTVTSSNKTVALECGSSFDEHYLIQAEASHFTIGAYGTGLRPKIYGSDKITGWSLHSGNIWKAAFGKDVNQVFVNDEKQQVARYPSVGYAVINTVNSTISVTSNELPNVNHSGAKVFIKTSTYHTHIRQVTSSTNSNKTIEVDEAPEGAPFDIYGGFVLMGKLEYLTQPGQWYQDAITKEVYLRTMDSDSPNNYTIRGSVSRGSGVNGNIISNASNTVIKDVHVLHSNTNGIKSNVYPTIENVMVSYPDAIGVDVGAYEPSITNCWINGATHMGISASISDNGVYKQNLITNTFLFENIGLSGNGIYWYQGSAMYISGNDNTIQFNRIDKSGYNGIQAHKRNLVDSNYITNVLMTKADGGAIYTSASINYQNTTTIGAIFSNNIISNVHGNIDGYSKWGDIRQSFGIYLDESSGGITVKNNIISDCDSTAIMVHRGHDHVIENNITYRNKLGIRVLKDGRGITISGNTIYGFSRDRLNTQDEAMINESDLTATPTIGNNKYVQHYKSIIFGYEGNAYDFTGWKTATGQDADSTFIGGALPAGHSEKLLVNTTKTAKTFQLNGATVNDVDGNSITADIVLQPFTGMIITGVNLELIA